MRSSSMDNVINGLNDYWVKAKKRTSKLYLFHLFEEALQFVKTRLLLWSSFIPPPELVLHTQEEPNHSRSISLTEPNDRIF